MVIIIIINGLLNKAIVTKVKLQLYHRQKIWSFIQQSGQVWDGWIKIPIVITQKLLHLVAEVIAQSPDRGPLFQTSLTPPPTRNLPLPTRKCVVGFFKRWILGLRRFRFGDVPKLAFNVPKMDNWVFQTLFLRAALQISMEPERICLGLSTHPKVIPKVSNFI